MIEIVYPNMPKTVLFTVKRHDTTVPLLLLVIPLQFKKHLPSTDYHIPLETYIVVRIRQNQR